MKCKSCGNKLEYRGRKRTFGCLDTSICDRCSFTTYLDLSEVRYVKNKYESGDYDRSNDNEHIEERYKHIESSGHIKLLTLRDEFYD